MPSRSVLGFAFATASALLYTGSNICLRFLVECDPIWVQCVKEVAIPVIIGPWLLVRAVRGQRVFPPWRIVGILLLGALATQLVGNPSFQWSLGIVGISLAVPILLGAIIVGGAVLGRAFLGEVIPRPLALSVTVLLAAIGLLALAASQNSPVSAMSSSEAPRVAAAGIMMAGVAGLLMAGTAFSTLAVVIRYGVRGESPLSTTTVIVGVTGVIVLGSLSLGRLGWEGIANTPPAALGVMIAAGFCNATAFLSLAKALELTSVVRVNAIGSSQCAMAAVAGVMVFGEPLSLALVAGVVLTVIGLSLMREPGHTRRETHVDRKRTPQDAAGNKLCRGHFPGAGCRCVFKSEAPLRTGYFKTAAAGHPAKRSPLNRPHDRAGCGQVVESDFQLF